MNTTTPTPTQRLIKAFEQMTGLSLTQQLCLVIGYLIGYFGLISSFIWIAWAFFIVVLYRAVREAKLSKLLGEQPATEPEQDPVP